MGIKTASTFRDTAVVGDLARVAALVKNADNQEDSSAVEMP